MPASRLDTEWIKLYLEQRDIYWLISPNSDAHREVESALEFASSLQPFYDKLSLVVCGSSACSIRFVRNNVLKQCGLIWDLESFCIYNQCLSCVFADEQEFITHGMTDWVFTAVAKKFIKKNPLWAHTLISFPRLFFNDRAEQFTISSSKINIIDKLMFIIRHFILFHELSHYWYPKLSGKDQSIMKHNLSAIMQSGLCTTHNMIIHPNYTAQLEKYRLESFSEEEVYCDYSAIEALCLFMKHYGYDLSDIYAALLFSFSIDRLVSLIHIKASISKLDDSVWAATRLGYDFHSRTEYALRSLALISNSRYHMTGNATYQIDFENQPTQVQFLENFLKAQQKVLNCLDAYDMLLARYNHRKSILTEMEIKNLERIVITFLGYDNPDTTGTLKFKIN